MAGEKYAGKISQAYADHRPYLVDLAFRMLGDIGSAEDAVGPDAIRSPAVVTGAEHVARNLLHFWGPGATLVSHPLGGQPALLGFRGRR